jgi:hypothetical protein
LLVQLLDRLKAMCSDSGPTAVKAAARALLLLSSPAAAAGVAGELAESLLHRLKVSRQV